MLCVAGGRRGLCRQPGLCLALGTLERLCLGLLLCRRGGSCPLLPGLPPCSGGQERSCSPCFFASPSAFFFFWCLTGPILVRLHHMPPSPLRLPRPPRRETRPLLLKVIPASSPSPGTRGPLALSSPGACGCSAEGARARRCPGPAPRSPLPSPRCRCCPARLPASFQTGPGRGGLPGWAARTPRPPAQSLECK